MAQLYLQHVELYSHMCRSVCELWGSTKGWDTSNAATAEWERLWTRDPWKWDQKLQKGDREPQTRCVRTVLGAEEVLGWSQKLSREREVLAPISDWYCIVKQRFDKNNSVAKLDIWISFSCSVLRLQWIQERESLEAVCCIFFSFLGLKTYLISS